MNEFQMAEMEFAAQARELLKRYGTDPRPDVQADLKQALRQCLVAQFDLQHRRRDEELQRVEKRVAELRVKLKRRAEAVNTIVDRRLEQLISDVDGLGWGADDLPQDLFETTSPGPSMPGRSMDNLKMGAPGKMLRGPTMMPMDGRSGMMPMGNRSMMGHRGTMPARTPSRQKGDGLQGGSSSEAAPTAPSVSRGHNPLPSSGTTPRIDPAGQATYSADPSSTGDGTYPGDTPSAGDGAYPGDNPPTVLPGSSSSTQEPFPPIDNSPLEPATSTTVPLPDLEISPPVTPETTPPLNEIKPSTT
jgi:hypothetical protein